MHHENRVALVTGGGKGIGRAIVDRLAADGFTVVIGDLDIESAQQACAALQERGLSALAVVLDVAQEESIRGVFERLEADYGRCDVLVNNAGIAKIYPYLEYPKDHWDLVFRINVTAPFLCSQHAGRLMVQHKWGRIINVASISGFRASTGRAAYGTSKAAVLGLTRQMAIELAPHGITANGIAPGPVDTPLTRALHSDEARDGFNRAVPGKRYGTPDEIACVASFLASEGASYVNGHVIPVDGGFLAAGVLEK
ncbi:SDR family NAD(P)-dependent oxidoreductase [Pollutimonas bauzanensis]|uniref:NAD(P)-dependent dehydrogenase, short-chain alcohol dehydrogenase family n=1 Tax=Pollutimonas bauzanensis TaxID=658167 RepID=A0A1M5X443_9BURK|nr:SDR family NAD(P)-dependent oxidoreductase [Pollutimonas bauzanensis]SHH94318.1 NAD(P)-dependent dehydrogenase, short-chain alcohol dehydrogenase family [Pollutimonas bauzanensis]